MALPTRRHALAGAAIALLSTRSHASIWPDDDTITWIVPFPTGGPTDTFARPIAQRVSEIIGQMIVIDNRGGAGGTVATAQAARATPDGYTFLVGLTSLGYAPVIYPQAKYDLVRDFAPISALARTQSSLIVNPSRLDVKTVEEFVEYARQSPGKIDIASPGFGTQPHLAIEMLEKRAGIKLHHIPYRGGGPALRDLLYGHVAAAFQSSSRLIDYIRSGELRALAVAGRRREPLLPEIPTMEEAGFRDFRVVSWFGVFAPRRTHETILNRMHGAIQEALADPEVKKLWREQGARVEPESRSDFARFVSADTERWRRIAEEASIQIE